MHTNKINNKTSPRSRHPPPPPRHREGGWSFAQGLAEKSGPKPKRRLLVQKTWVDISQPRGSPYLSEGQTIFVLVSVLHLKIIQGFALGQSLWQGPDTLDVAGWEEAMSPLQLPVVPVLIHLTPQDDDVPFVELEVTGFFALIAVEGLAVGKLG